VTPVPAVAIAVRDTVRFTVAPGDANETDGGALIPPVVFPPMPLFIPPVIVYMAPLPPQAASTMTNIPTTPTPETFANLTRLSFIGDFLILCRSVRRCAASSIRFHSTTLLTHFFSVR
jgi:hypothetical protein